MDNQKAIVVFSGGQDSTTCLGWAKNRFQDVTALGFQYGQRHIVEMEQAKRIAAKLNVPIRIINLDFYADLVRSALVHSGDVNASHVDHENLPSSFVPNRNTLFLLLAHTFAIKKKANIIVTGFSEADYSGYPDCRNEFVEAMEKALNLGSEQAIEIKTPLMYLSKAQTFALAKKEGILSLVIEESHTCYEGIRTKHDWGAGCGTCPACKLRAKGFQEFQSKLA